MEQQKMISINTNELAWEERYQEVPSSRARCVQLVEKGARLDRRPRRAHGSHQSPLGHQLGEQTEAAAAERLGRIGYN